MDDELKRGLAASLAESEQQRRAIATSREELEAALNASIAEYELRLQQRQREEQESLARAKEESLQLQQARERETITRRLLQEAAERRAVDEAISTTLQDDLRRAKEEEEERRATAAALQASSSSPRMPVRPPPPLIKQRRTSRPLPVPPQSLENRQPTFIRALSEPLVERTDDEMDPFSDIHAVPLTRAHTMYSTHSSSSVATSLDLQETEEPDALENSSLEYSGGPTTSSLIGMPSQNYRRAPSEVYSASLPELRDFAKSNAGRHSSSLANNANSFLPHTTILEVEECPTNVRIGFPAIDPELLTGTAFPGIVELSCQPDIRLQTFCIEAKTYRSLVEYLMWNGQASIRASPERPDDRASIVFEFYGDTRPVIRLCISLVSAHSITVNSNEHRAKFRAVMPISISLPIVMVDLATKLHQINRTAKLCVARGEGNLYDLGKEIASLARAHHEAMTLEDKQAEIRKNKTAIKRLRNRLKGHRQDTVDSVRLNGILPETANFITPFTLPDSR